MRPDTKVLFQFSEGAGGVTNFFTLDDTVKGKLDNTVYTLGGEFSVVDVTEYVRSVTVSRGRSRILDEVQAGSADIDLDNRQRLFDPTAAASVTPYAGDILPRRNVQITVNDEPIFTGLVEDWNITYTIDNDSVTTARCGDGFVVLGQATVPAVAQSSELSGTRIGSVLDDAEWVTSKRDIDAGEVTLQADTPGDNTNVIQYLQTISKTEFGAFYMSREGLATFRDRDAFQDFSNPLELGGAGIPISSIAIDYGTEQLFNEISVERVGGSVQTVSASASQVDYGLSELSLTGLLYTSDDDSLELADYLLSRYKDPTYRIDEVSIYMDGLTTAQQASVAALEVTDPLQVTHTPAVGDPIVQFAAVDRISHSITPGGHYVTITMSQAQPSFLLDSDEFGVLDTSTLGF